jgi:hypothetical protein
MTVKLNSPGYEHAKRVIEEGKFTDDERDAWSDHHPSTQIENEFIEENGFSEYGECAGLVNRVTYSLSEMPNTASSRLLSVRFDCPGGDRASFQNCPSAFFKPRRIASSFIASVLAFRPPASSASAAGESLRRRFISGSFVQLTEIP